MKAQGCRHDEQNLKLDALQKSQRRKRTNSPPRRHHATSSPPRQEAIKQRCPDLERVDQSARKRERTPPLREGKLSQGKRINATKSVNLIGMFI
ncbi:hypothetical protein L195_g055921 [Trifolium pratense]|uniref:Uncharacterized protein n=1 Tax=Trifolium pratense TaxID=57577 RepID=A0A2K3KP02_TRIPR|nr:hypothetical protein L195_g055921 [Trifolium pratense]